MISAPDSVQFLASDYSLKCFTARYLPRLCSENTYNKALQRPTKIVLLCRYFQAGKARIFCQEVKSL
jgi:hypothetical protein